MDIIKGLDGYHIIQNSKLVKIVEAYYSENYWNSTAGYVKYTLENGQKIISGTKE